MKSHKSKSDQIETNVSEASLNQAVVSPQAAKAEPLEQTTQAEGPAASAAGEQAGLDAEPRQDEGTAAAPSEAAAPAGPTAEAASQPDQTEAAAAEAEEPHHWTPEEIEALKAEAAKAKEHWDALLRTAADFENFRKRVARERAEAQKYANEALLMKLLPVLDHLEMALAAARDAQQATLESIQTGVRMIHQQLKSALQEAGLEEIDATRQEFDPQLHEAMSQMETEEVPEGHVVQQIRKGYKLHDRLLRPASVVVAKKPAPPAPESAPQTQSE